MIADVETATAATPVARGARPGRLHRAIWRPDHPVRHVHLRPARPVDHHRPDRHRQHAVAVDQRAHPRARAPPGGRAWTAPAASAPSAGRPCSSRCSARSSGSASAVSLELGPDPGARQPGAHRVRACRSGRSSRSLIGGRAPRHGGVRPSRPAGPPSSPSSTPSPRSDAAAHPARTPVRVGWVACSRRSAPTARHLAALAARRRGTRLRRHARRGPAPLPRRRRLGRPRAGLVATGTDALFDAILERGALARLRAPDVRPGRRRAPAGDRALARRRPPILDQMARTPRPPLRRPAAVDLRQPLPRRPRLGGLARRPHRPSTGRHGRRHPVAGRHPHAAAPARRRRSVHRVTRSTRATCSCRAAPASAPSSTACPSGPTPARASASCSGRPAATEPRRRSPR